MPSLLPLLASPSVDTPSRRGPHPAPPPLRATGVPPHSVGNRPAPWPLIEVPRAELRRLAQALHTAHVDQALVLDLIQAGLGGSDLARWVAEPLLARLQHTDPVSAAWAPLVLQALRDPREVWEPAFLPDRARLRSHLLAHPGALLQALYLQLLRPWSVPLLQWREQVVAGPASAGADWPALRALRGDAHAPARTRDASLQALQQQWRDWVGGTLPEPVLTHCLTRVHRLNRRERGVWEPLLAVDVLRDHLHGTPALARLLKRVHLQEATAAGTPRHPLAARMLRVALRARQDPMAVMPFAPTTTRRTCSVAALCGLMAAQHLHTPAIPLDRMSSPRAPVAGQRRHDADLAGPSLALPGVALAPLPLWAGTQAGALTVTGRPPAAPRPAACLGVSAETADPPLMRPASGGGLRPVEALRTVAHRFTVPVSAHWLGVAGRTASDFNAALHTLLRDADVPASEREPGDAAVAALFEQGDALISDTLQRAELPWLARQLLKRTRASTRIYLLTLALSRLYAHIQPRAPGDAAMAEAAQWMRSVDACFRAQITDPAVRDSVQVGDAAAWPRTTTTVAPPLSVEAGSSTPAPWTPAINASALAAAVQAVLPRNASVLASVLTHVLGHWAFPDPADLESTLHRLYASNATTTLIAQVLSLPPSTVDDTVNQWFFARLADVPLDADLPAPHLVRWQAQLRRREPAHQLRRTWITQLTPDQAAALLARDDAGGVQRLLQEALPTPTDAAAAWTARLRTVQRLGTWLDTGRGQQRMAALLRGKDATGAALPRFLMGNQGLPRADGSTLMQRAVLHYLGNDTFDTLQPLLVQARASPSPVLSLAVALHARHPLLHAEACVTHAAVLLLPTAPPMAAPASAPVLDFPLPALPVNATLPSLHLHALLSDCGLALLERLDADLPAWQAWDLIVQTHAFTHAADALRRAVGGEGDATALLARWILDRGIGARRVASLIAALDGTSAREQPMQQTRAFLQAQLPAFPSSTARALLWWLIVRQAGRPEWLVADLPEWLDHGRSLESLSLLHGAALLDAVAPGATAQWSYTSVLRIPRQLVGAVNDTDAAEPSPWLQALVRPALRYAQAQAAVAGSAAPTAANARDVAAALDRVARHQASLAQAAGQLARRPPQRMELAAQQLREAGVPARYWNQTLFDLPDAVQRAAGLVRHAGAEAVLECVAWGVPSVVRAAEDAIAHDTLQQLLVGGVYTLSGRPSVPQLYEQAFALYRQQMTDALAAMLTRTLDMLCTADRQLLRRSRVTPLRVPAGPRGAVLRCEGPAPTYFVLVPSAGHAARLVTGDRFDGQHWRSGLLHDPRAFITGEVADHSDPTPLRFLDLSRCQAGATMAPRTAAGDDDAALVNEVATLMYGDFFNRTRDAELSQLTGMEELRRTEADFADGLAAFAVPFYGCVTGLAKGEYASAAVDCTMDALSMLTPAARLGRFLRSTTRLAVRGGEVTATALLRDTGAALLRLGGDVAEQSGLALVRDLGRGTLRLGRQGTAWVLDRLPALEFRLARRLRSARLEELQWRATARAGAKGAAMDDIAPGFAVDGQLLDDLDDLGVGTRTMQPGCPRVRRQIDVAQCAGESIALFGHEPSPVYDTPGEVTWFAGMQVRSYEPLAQDGRLFVFDGAYWRQSRTDTGFRFARAPGRAAPPPRQHIRATVVGGEHQLVRVELHNPYPDHLMSISQGAVIGRTRDGQRALITRVAPGRFYVAAVEGEATAGKALQLWPLEHQGFTAAQNDAIKTAWWGAFHYSQQCRLSGAQLVDQFGSQLQRQLDQLDELGTLLEEVRSGSPYLFENLPAQAVMSCAQSNCRYVQELRRQIGPDHWRAPRDSDDWIDTALRDLLNPLPPQDTLRVFHGMDATLESRFLTPKRGPAKTVAMARVTVKDDPVPLVFHATSGQRKGRSLLPIANLDRKGAPAGWVVEGKEVRTPHARYVDAQPTVVSIQRGDVAGTVPNHSLHAEDRDGPLFNERNTRAYDAERNLYYRIEQYIERGQLDPDQVTSAEVFSSRRICPSCHIAVGSLRARFPGSTFTVIEREVAPAAALLDNRPQSAP